jgi:Flp pilus assembly protein TadG
MTTCSAMKRKRSPRREAGAVLVELAVTLPILMLVFLGAVDFSRVFFSAIELGNAVTSGAEYGARTTGTATDTVGISSVVTADAANLTGVVVPTPTSYCTCPTSGTHVNCSTFVCTTPSGYGKPKMYVSVTANYTWTSLVTWPGLPNSVVLTRTIVMRAR